MNKNDKKSQAFADGIEAIGAFGALGMDAGAGCVLGMSMSMAKLLKMTR